MGYNAGRSNGSLVEINPQRIAGRWRTGYALDFHTLSSTYLGVDEFGRDRYDTKRSPMSELIYKLKYQMDTSVVTAIVDTVAGFIPKALSSR